MTTLPSTCEVVLFDALGTLLRLDPPWPLLSAALRSRHGIEVDDGDAREAMLAEIAFYRAHHDEGRDAASLTELRRRCAAVLAEHLPATRALTPDDMVEVLLDAIRFSPYEDAAPALGTLRALGIRTGVVSNWDCSLHGVLSGLGLSGLLDVVVTSAEAGAAKPDPAVFRAALQEVRCAREKALFVGDSRETDVAGALRAGMRAVLIDRSPAPPTATPGERIFTLAALEDLLSAPMVP